MRSHNLCSWRQRIWLSNFNNLAHLPQRMRMINYLSADVSKCAWIIVTTVRDSLVQQCPIIPDPEALDSCSWYKKSLIWILIVLIWTKKESAKLPSSSNETAQMKRHCWHQQGSNNHTLNKSFVCRKAFILKQVLPTEPSNCTEIIVQMHIATSSADVIKSIW